MLTLSKFVIFYFLTSISDKQMMNRCLPIFNRFIFQFSFPLLKITSFFSNKLRLSFINFFFSNKLRLSFSFFFDNSKFNWTIQPFSFSVTFPLLKITFFLFLINSDVLSFYSVTTQNLIEQNNCKEKKSFYPIIRFS